MTARLVRTAELRPVSGYVKRIYVGWTCLVIAAPAFDLRVFGVSLEGAASASATLALLAVALDEK